MALRILFQGSPGSFSEIAARQVFSADNLFVGTREFREIFQGVSERRADRGIVPLENSLAGSVYENYDLLFRHPVTIVGETYVEVHHHLLGVAGEQGEGRISSLKRVFSHPKAIEQCAPFFESHPAIEKVFSSDTAGAAKKVAELGDPALAAIASREAAAQYGLVVLAEHLESDRHNLTRFIQIAREDERARDSAQKPADKCSIQFLLAHRKGSLAELLGALSQEGANLTKIESRPRPGSSFEYRFFVDFLFGEAGAEPVLSRCRAIVAEMKVLGIYPSAEIPVGTSAQAG